MLSPDDHDRHVEDAGAISAYWPERIIELSKEWSANPQASREKLLGEMWQLLNMALVRYLRVHRKRYEYGDDDDLRDIASQKSLELLNKLDKRVWSPAEGSAAQLCAFVSTLARNGLIDHLRVIGSKRPREGGSLHDTAWNPVQTPGSADPDSGADRRDFVIAIKNCTEQMQPRVRTVWFLRVLLGMPAKEIARHPAVRMKPGTIDVTLSRCRDAVKACMHKKGYRPDDMPAGTFVTLWETFEGDVRALMKPGQE